MAQIHGIPSRRSRPRKGRVPSPKRAPRRGWSVAQILGLAAGGGLLFGVGSLAMTPGGTTSLMSRPSAWALRVNARRKEVTTGHGAMRPARRVPRQSIWASRAIVRASTEMAMASHASRTIDRAADDLCLTGFLNQPFVG